VVIRIIWWLLLLASAALTYLLVYYVAGFLAHAGCTECGEGTWLSVAFLFPFAAAIVVFCSVGATRAFRVERALGLLILAVAVVSLAAFLVNRGSVT
jgi:hypothetical protein